MKTHTVSSLHRESGQGCMRRHTRVPAVRLTGKWLAALGFTAGVKIRVHATAGTLTLTTEAAQ